MNHNLPDGVRVSDIPGFRSDDVAYDHAIAWLTEDLHEIIKQYKQEYPLSDRDIVVILEDLKPIQRGG